MAKKPSINAEIDAAQRAYAMAVNRGDQREKRLQQQRITRLMKRRRRGAFGSADRFVVVGPARWPRSFHTSENAALAAGHKCSKQFPNAICKVTYGLPGMQKTIAECNRNECWRTGSLGKRKRRGRKGRR